MSSSLKAPRRPQHILQLSPQQRRQFLDSFEQIFCDIDGVVWNIERNMPQVADGFAALRRAGKQLSFITNNSVRTEEQCIQRFGHINMVVAGADIWHPAKVMVHYLRSINFTGLIYIIATPSFKSVLHQAGFQLLDGPDHLIDETVPNVIRNILDNEPVQAVIIDVDFNLSLCKLLRAHLYLRRPDCLLLIGATDRMLPIRQDLNIIGPGPFTDILVEASGKAGVVMGKPSKLLGDLLLQHYKLAEPARVLMIGDMLLQDIRFARTCGFQSLLVLTGGCTLSALEAETDADQLPDYYADSVADFVQLLNEAIRSHV